VICCEGNAGYYEIGCTMTPLEGGYSILAWNHPGFGGSTNVPWPKHERAAIDVVVQFAINQLGFDEEQIVLLAWSIGGFSATWAAARYPAIGGLFLDATFDDLSPLAKSKMPRSWAPLVARTVRKYLDLPIARQLHFYPGPVQLIRRRKDEVIFTDETRPLATNRANHLLKQLFEQRYPKLFNDQTEALLDRWLEAEEVERMTMKADFNAEDDLFYADLLRSYIEENGTEFPLNIGAQLPLEQQQALVLFLASRYCVDFDTTHCTPLPREMFRPPRHPWELLID